jgi:hypothetical protein
MPDPDTRKRFATVRRSDAINARRWFVHGSPKLTELALAAYETFGVTTFEGMEPNASGDMGPIQRERPVLQLITSPLYYHSDHDLGAELGHPPGFLNTGPRYAGGCILTDRSVVLQWS